MKSIATGALALMLGSSGLAAAQDSLVVETEIFSSLNAGGQFNLVASIGDSHSVVLEGSAGDFDKLDIEVNRGELVVRQDRRWWSDNEMLDVTVRITVPSLMGLDFHRGVSAEVDGLSADMLDVAVNTGAMVRITGTCSEMELDLNTGGMLNARDLVCERVEVDASTGGSGSVHATQRAEVAARMGAEIDVYGKPERHEFSAFMGAEIDVH
ncbi:head GIN domain-containing protein [Maricaulis sp. CAU 1757]